MKEKDYLKRVALNIRKIRKDKGMTQVDLAYACGFEKQNMQRIEAGKTSPTLKTLLKISEALEVDIRDLILSNLDK
jgi:transcriptional regulator with XRE-family HTH domain